MSESELPSGLMLFDLSIYGHHPNYIRYLIKYWQKNHLSGTLDIVVIPEFLEVHRDVVELVANPINNGINFIAISPQEAAKLTSTKSALKRNLRYFVEWQILRKYARTLKVKHCLALYFDTYQIPLLLDPAPPCQISGIYFKPTFHYQQLAKTTATRKEKIQQFRETTILTNLLRKPELNTLFSLDNYVLQYLPNIARTDKLIPLPDPVIADPLQPMKVDKLRYKLKIERSRQIFLVFGALSARKGINEIFQAINLLSNELCDRICLLLVGETNSENQSRFISQIEQLSQQKPVQIVSNFEFVSDSEVPIYFQLSDLVLAPYQRHVGMSGILLLAAAAGKPVLSSDYGLMGQLVREYQLGMAVDAAKPQAIAEELTKFLLISGEMSFKSSQMSAFVAANSAERFAEVIFKRILSDES